MIDIKFLRENPDIVKENIKNKFQEQKLVLAEQKALEGTGLTDLNKYLEYLQSISAPQEAIAGIQTLIQGKAKLEQEKGTLQGYKKELNAGLEEYNKGLKSFEAQKQELENKKPKVP